MTDDVSVSVHKRWAQFRFAVVGQLLSTPPPKGQLRSRIEELAAKSWTHPIRGEPIRFGFSTIERWYYMAQPADDPVGVLRRQVRKDQGTHPSLSEEQRQAVRSQHERYPEWTTKLHFDNLLALARKDPGLGLFPSYSTVGRFMKAEGLRRVPRRKKGEKETGAEHKGKNREIRSFEVAQVNALWHFDFHFGSLKVLEPNGEWVTPVALAVLDDRSRLCCHCQWYLGEDTECLVHGFGQALMKRGLPRKVTKDGGSAMKSAEFRSGLELLSILNHTTRPYSAWQNGKEEFFWNPLEDRLVAMLLRRRDLTLRELNELTQAWVEMEYNRRHHREIGTTPLKRFLAGPDLSRPCPPPERLRFVFTRRLERTQRRSDGTILLANRRFEVPARFHHERRLRVRFAAWDLSRVFLVDADDDVLAPLFPLDKEANADGRRRVVDPKEGMTKEPKTEPGLPPLLEELVREYEATGLPYAYLPGPGEAEGAAGEERGER